MNVGITRCCNNYGLRQFPEKIIPLFVSNLIDGKRVPIYGDGKQIREWIHVDDHCRGIATVLERAELVKSIILPALMNLRILNLQGKSSPTLERQKRKLLNS